MINIKFVRCALVVYVSHKRNVLVTDIILNITSREHFIFTSLHIGSRLFELFNKEVRVKKQPGMPLRQRNTTYNVCGDFPTILVRLGMVRESGNNYETDMVTCDQFTKPTFAVMQSNLNEFNALKISLYIEK